jgi:hypothetical protein
VIKVFSASEAGGHSVNEDAFLVRQHPDDSSCWICALADGQGGRSGGGRAAQFAAFWLMRLAEHQSPSLLMDVRAWATFFQQTDASVEADKDAGFTTLVGLCVKDDKICGGSNGDSAVAIFDKTREGSEQTAYQMKNPPIGSGTAAFVPFATELQGPRMVVAMSDGVWKYVRWDRIKETGKRLRGQAFVDEMLQLARLPGSGGLQDDFTLVVMQNDADGS